MQDLSGGKIFPEKFSRDAQRSALFRAPLRVAAKQDHALMSSWKSPPTPARHANEITELKMMYAASGQYWPGNHSLKATAMSGATAAGKRDGQLVTDRRSRAAQARAEQFRDERRLHAVEHGVTAGHAEHDRQHDPSGLAGVEHGIKRKREHNQEQANPSRTSRGGSSDRKACRRAGSSELRTGAHDDAKQDYPILQV